ncbi:hypothetical protein MNBD_GAMMA15-674 [hydrothermal vent metagenome]|uniref:Uncharacterized protein n=1 Tax=hydrothermal vent metagenome TaxID=652676 RepID=A0A3B0YGT4_9ZZZZ
MMMKHRFLTGLLGVILFTGAQASHLKFSLDDIILLSQRGVSEQTLLLFIENREAGFRLDAEAIDRLALAGVSEEVIRYLLSSEPVLPVPRTVVRRIPPVTYVDPYPGYYYTPYYYGASYSFGFSSYPAYWFGHYSGARPHGGNRHHGGYLAHNGHSPTHVGGGNHSGLKRRHSDSGALRHATSKVHQTAGHGKGSGSASHAGAGKVHAGTGVNKHDGNGNSGRHSTGNRHSSGGGHNSSSVGHSSRSGGGHNSSGGHSSRSGGGHSGGRGGHGGSH